MRGHIPIWLIVFASTMAVHPVDAKAFERTFDYFYTVPKCGPYAYEVAATLRDGSSRSQTVKNVFCLDSDHRANRRTFARSRFEAIFLQAYPTLDQVYLHAWSFNDRPLLDSICSSVRDAGASIVLLEYEGEAHLTSPGCLAAGIVQLPVRWASGIKVFHTKAYAAVHDGTVDLVVSSGHPRRGFSLNFEFWLSMQLEVRDPLWGKHLCFFEASKLVAETEVGLWPAQDFFRECVAPLESVAGELVEPYFLPFEQAEFRQQVESLASQATDIDLSSLGVGSSWLLEVLERSMKAGTKVRFVADDDALWAGDLCPDDCMGDASSFDNWIAPLRTQGMQIRYLETNQQCAGNYLHHKLMAFTLRDGTNVAIVGSANFTDAAFGVDPSIQLSGNVENQYVLREFLAAEVSTNFAQLWDIATAEERMPQLNIDRPLQGENC